MPTVLGVDGLRIVIYPNDHVPAHVHVMGAGWTIVVELVAVKVRAAIGCDERVARRVLQLVAGHRTALMNSWMLLHG
jgi:hypothetical protein